MSDLRVAFLLFSRSISVYKYYIHSVPTLRPGPDARADYFAERLDSQGYASSVKTLFSKREPDKSSPPRSREVIDSRMVIYDFPFPLAGMNCPLMALR